MADDFDPYYTWLGIPPEEQPADHYRVLGVRRFENNPDVITNATDQRMTFLRSLQAGNHSALSQRILNEVSAASVVLLDPVKRAYYDESLRGQEVIGTAAGPVPPLATIVPPPVAASPAPPPLPVPKSPHITTVDGPESAPPLLPRQRVFSNATIARRPPRSRLWQSPLVVGLAAFAIVVLGGTLLMGPNQTAPKSADDRTTALKSSAQQQPAQSQGETPTRPQPSSPADEPPKEWWNDDAVRRRLFALQLTGSAHAELSNTAALVDLSKSFTVEAWVKATFSQDGFADVFGTHLGGRVALGRPGTHNVPGGWGIMVQRDPRRPQSRWVISYWDAGSRMPRLRSKVAPATLEQWTHLALVHEPGIELILFVNGHAAARIRAEPNPIGNQRDLRLGANPNFDPPSGISVQICGLRISNRRRYSADFKPPVPVDFVDDADTVGTLDFQTPQLDSVQDSNAGAHHAALAGATWVALDSSVSLPFTRSPAP